MAPDLTTFATDVFGAGKDAQDLTIEQLCARALLVYLAALLLVRLVRNRFLGHYTVFDIVLGFVFGSMISRAINGQAPVFETLVAGAFLLAVHELFGFVGARWHGFSRWTKGTSKLLIEEGRPNWAQVRRSGLSREDLEEAIRIGGRVSSDREVQVAMLERNGKISVVPKHRARVLDVGVAEGVQTVRIVLEA